MYCIVHLCLFFSSSRSSLDVFSIFSIHASILFLRFYIIFTVIILKSFLGRVSVSPSFSCSFITLLLHLQEMYYLLFHFFPLTLCLQSPFCKHEDYNSSCSGVCLLVVEVDTEWGIPFALWLSMPCQELGVLPSCWSRGPWFSFLAVFLIHGAQ